MSAPLKSSLEIATSSVSKESLALLAELESVFGQVDFSSPHARATLAAKLVADGDMEDEMQADRFVSLAARATSEAVAGALGKAILAGLATIKSRRAAASYFAEAEAEVAEIDTLRGNLRRAEEMLERAKQRLAGANVEEAKAAENYCQRILAPNLGIFSSIEFMQQLVAERALAPFITANVIPHLEREVADAKTALEAATVAA